ncbi:MAG: 4-(cytidine 5'-diphospho)-2-C-methyl-D-erythritol kinase [Clostridiales bacterium]|jgi:4-diphosphocytidyl-2-C-methyl-D-erythritol kinase|nr:4-(cytidine 5'-diphospho)-2-C-methyl-D-erythritol kinase [Clostridiales bacterium]
MTIYAPAKINLSLDVTEKRSDGYHEIETLMQTVSLRDEIALEKSDVIEMSTNRFYLPCDERNLAFRAAQAFFAAANIDGGVKITLRKNIPVGAGLGGGSSDAAAVLKGLNALYDANLSMEKLTEIGAGLGADVPFFFTGGTCLARGMGERLTPVQNNLKCFIVIVKPEFSISTKWVYQNLKLNEIKQRPDTNAMIDALERGDLRAAAQNMCNVLEGVTAKRCGHVGVLKSRMTEAGAIGAMMSGSGSAVFGLFEREQAARKCVTRLKAGYHQVFISQGINSL